jgi:uncharacterized membrane protein YfcA
MSDLPWPVRDGLTLALALIAGVLSGSFSMGGQVLMKPGIRLLGASPLGAVGTTVPMILPTVATATVTYHRRGLVDWAAVRWAAPGGVIGAIVGSVLAPRVPGEGHLLQVATAGLMLFTGVRMMRRGRRRRDEPPQAPAEVAGRPRPAGWAMVGSASGVLSGLLGVGGGVLMVPGFSQLLAMPLVTAIATSLVCAGIFAIPATIAHSLLGTIEWRFAILLIAGAVPGARLGARLTARAGDRRLETAVGVVVTIIAITYAAGELLALR